MALNESVCVRLETKVVDELTPFTEKRGTGVSAVIRDLIPPGPWLDVLAREAEAKGLTVGATLLDLAARALKVQVLGEIKAYPTVVHPHFVESHGGRYPVVEFYRAYLEAIRADRGEGNSDGGEPEYYFAEVPPGGGWEKMGINGYGILHKTERFTPDGIEKVVFIPAAPSM